jgi:hypothetical protein
MTSLDGTIWRLVESRAWDEAGQPLPAPYGAMPIGQISFAHGRMLASLCNGDAGVAGAARGFSAYGGPDSFDGDTLEVSVDMASDPSRIGGKQRRGVVLEDQTMLLRPPVRLYGATRERRELTWSCIWRAPPA